MNPVPEKRFKAAACLLIALAVILIYGQSARFELVNFDDPLFIQGNPTVLRGLSLDGIAYAFGPGTRTANYFIPLVWLSFMADCEFFGPSPAALHLTNVLLHLGNVFLLLAALSALTKKFWPSALAAALFAVHPLHVESVAWVTERKDVLSGFFFLAALLFYARYAERPSIPRFLMVFGAFVLGLLSKPIVVVLPLLLLVLDFWPLKRFSGSPRGAARLLAEKIPFFLLVPAVSLVTVYFQAAGDSFRSLSAVPLWDRLAGLPLSYGFYLGKLFAPANLSVIYPAEAHPPLLAWAGTLGLLAALTLAALALWRRAPWLLAGWLWFGLVLFPVSGIFVIGDYTVADRYAYLSAIGVYLALAESLERLAARGPAAKRAVTASALVALAVLVVASNRQAAHWRDSVALFSRAVAVTGPNFKARFCLGTAFFEKGRYGEAVSEWEKAREIEPWKAEPLNNMGVAFRAMGRKDEALRAFREALRISPDYPQARGNLESLTGKTGGA